MSPKLILLTLLGVSSVGGMIVGGYFFMRPTNIGELLTSENFTLLDVVGNKNGKEWKLLIPKHTGTEVTITGSNKVNVISDLKFDGATTEDQKVTKIKEKCKALFEKSISKDTAFETDKSNAKNWCTLESPVLKEVQKTQPVRTSSTTDNHSTPLQQTSRADNSHD